MDNVKDAIAAQLKSLQAKKLDKLLATRYSRLMSYGKFKVLASK